MIAYEAHNEYVRRTVPASRLFEWQPEDGWGPVQIKPESMIRMFVDDDATGRVTALFQERRAMALDDRMKAWRRLQSVGKLYPPAFQKA